MERAVLELENIDMHGPMKSQSLRGHLMILVRKHQYTY